MTAQAIPGPDRKYVLVVGRIDAGALLIFTGFFL
jgi:hypothetical protein